MYGDARRRPQPVPGRSALDRGQELFRRKPKPEVGQTCLLIAFEACDLRLRRLPGLELRQQLDPPNQLRHQLTLVS
jgi:hypothetical protein